MLLNYKKIKLNGNVRFEKWLAIMNTLLARDTKEGCDLLEAFSLFQNKGCLLKASCNLIVVVQSLDWKKLMLIAL